MRRSTCTPAAALAARAVGGYREGSACVRLSAMGGRIAPPVRCTCPHWRLHGRDRQGPLDLWQLGTTGSTSSSSILCYIYYLYMYVLVYYISYTCGRYYGFNKLFIRRHGEETVNSFMQKLSQPGITYHGMVCARRACACACVCACWAGHGMPPAPNRPWPTRLAGTLSPLCAQWCGRR